MNRIVVICGVISGALVSTFMVCSMAVCYQKEAFEGNMLLGYAAMLLSFSMVFVGIKNYRDKYSGGSVSFGKAFKIGLYITLVASTVYVIVWLIDYYIFIPDFIHGAFIETVPGRRSDRRRTRSKGRRTGRI